MQINEYDEMKKRHQEELNRFPIAFAFTDEQFKDGLKKLGLKETDIDKVCSIGSTGGFIKITDVDNLKNMFKKHNQEHSKNIENDKTGTGYIKDMFISELINHEYIITNDLESSLMALGLNYEDIQKDNRLATGLKLATKEISKQDKIIESEQEYETEI